MIKYEITNFYKNVSVFTYLGYTRLGQLETQETFDKKFADAFRDLRGISIKEIEVDDDPMLGANMRDLYKEAKALGAKLGRGMSKLELVKVIKEAS